MTRPLFLKDSRGVSLLYDAILFLVMVSLAGVILLPALQSPVAVTSSVETHRERTADAALRAFLVTRADLFEYQFGGTLLDTVAGSIGINTSSEGLYKKVAHWLLAHEQRHKTYGTLLAEDLGCQFRVPFTVLGTNQLNLLTTSFDQQLRNDTDRFFSAVCGEKYGYNVSAWWHPITSIPFGGEFTIGPPPPLTNTYVAYTILSMPYTPVFTVGNHTVVLTRYWLMQHLFTGDISLGRSSIPSIANITLILENYTNGHPPFDTRENATIGVKENLSALLYGFLIYGITNETNATVFPGIVSMTVAYGFDTIRGLTQQLTGDVVNESFGELVRVIDRLFAGLNSSVIHPLSSRILEEVNATIHDLVNTSFGSFDEAFAACVTLITTKVAVLLDAIIDPSLEALVRIIFDGVDLVKGLAERLVDYLCDQVSLTTAEVTLTLWVVRT
jgi:hypothetical protein